MPTRPHQQWREMKKLERAKGFEPSTPTLARLCSTPELHPLTVPRRLDFRARRPRRRSLNTIPPDDASASFSNRDDSPVRVWRKPLADLAQAGPGPAGGGVGAGIGREENAG